MVALKGKQQGISLIELLMVLSAISAILSSIFILDNVRSAMEVKSVVNIIASVKDAYHARHTYKGLNNEEAVKFDMVPKNMIKSLPHDKETILRHGWGGDVFLGTGKLRQKDDRMRLTYHAVPSESCLNLLTSTVNIADAIWVAGSLVKNTKIEPLINFDITRSAAACRIQKTVTIIWEAQ